MISFDAELKTLRLESETNKETFDIYRTCIPILVATVRRDQLKTMFGERTTELAFGSMRGDGTFPYKAVAPKIVHGVHDVTISGIAFRGAPDIRKIVPGAETGHVDLHIAMPFSSDHYQQATFDLVKVHGSIGLAVEMAPIQPELVGTEDGGTSKVSRAVVVKP